MKTILVLLLSGLTSFADITIYPVAVPSGAGVGSGCPGTYKAQTTYVKTISQGWGWPTNGVTPITATYTNDSTAWIQMVGKNGDIYCGTGTVSAMTPRSSKYRFAIYLANTNGIGNSTNNFPLILHGFNP